MRTLKHEEIIRLANSNMQPKDIAKTLNYVYSSVLDILHKNGFKYKLNQGNVRYFQTIDTNTKAYLLGLIAADGYIVRSNKSSMTFGIQINIEDKAALELLRSEIGSEKALTYPTNKMVRFTLSNPLIISDLNNLGITERKSFTLCNVLNNIDKKFHSEFICGYLDGDGCFVLQKNPNRTAFTVSFRGTEALLTGIKNSLNLSHLNLHFNTTYTLSIQKISEVYAFSKLYDNNNFRLQRKLNKLRKGISKIILKYPKGQTISSPY